MKKFGYLAIAFAFATSTASFAAGHGKGGCGLGSIVMGPDGNQVLAATTNGTSGSQTFGISSGTSNCDSGGGQASTNLPNYIEANRVALASDVARGSGETVVALSHLLGCSNVEAVGSALQKNYDGIFSSQGASPAAMSDAIVSTIRLDAPVARSCKRLG